MKYIYIALLCLMCLTIGGALGKTVSDTKYQKHYQELRYLRSYYYASQVEDPDQEIKETILYNKQKLDSIYNYDRDYEN